jgi:alpha-tubulin suppressor-like RCC1 family protein
MFSCRHALRSFAVLVFGAYAAASFAPTAAAATLAAGMDFGCAIVDQGVMCWGSNEFGQIGNPLFGDVSTATAVATLEPGTNAGVTAIAAGARHACAVVKGGVKCWGRNSFGQLGVYPLTDRKAPVAPVSQNLGATAIAAGYSHTCAIVNGAVWCWGSNDSYQLGNDTTVSTFVPVETLPASANAKVIAAGDYHTCAIADGGILECWGSNASGQISPIGAYTPNVTLPRTVLLNEDHPVSVAAGSEHTCVINPDGNFQGAVRCWGTNLNGQLGNDTYDGQFTAYNAPTVAGAGSNASFVAAGGDHSCAIVNGVVSCWGANSKGELGIGSQDDTPHATPIGGLSTLTEVTSGAQQTCARTSGTGLNVFCWGRKGHGRLGGGRDERVTSPTVLSLGQGLAQTIALGSHHGCLILTTGAVKCWGQNLYGQVGNGAADRNEVIFPVAVSGIASGANMLSLGAAHSCAVVGNKGKCWGEDDYGQLNDGSAKAPQPTPVFSAIPTAISQVAAGAVHTCALASDGIWCAGKSQHGETGTITFYQDQPYKIPSLAGANITGVASGTSHSCAIVSGGVKCWGANDQGQLGLANDNGDHPVPYQTIAANSGVQAIAAGANHTCAMVEDAVRCWGANTHGQLGNGFASGYIAMPDYIPLSGITAVAAGGDHTCALVDTTMECWGRGDSGEIGVRNFDDVYTPVHPNGLDFAVANTVKAIAAGVSSSCAVVSDANNAGQARCWGSNEDAALGVFATDFQNTPNPVKANDTIFFHRFEVKP